MKKPEEIKEGLKYISTTNIARKVMLAKSGKFPYAYTEEVASDALAYIQQLEAQVPKWISVDERLPDEGGEYIVLVQLPNGTKDRRWDVFCPDAGWCEDCDAKVLFWMSFDSLPEVPKEGIK